MLLYVAGVHPLCGRGAGCTGIERRLLSTRDVMVDELNIGAAIPQFIIDCYLLICLNTRHLLETSAGEGQTQEHCILGRAWDASANHQACSGNRRFTFIKAGLRLVFGNRDRDGG